MNGRRLGLLVSVVMAWTSWQYGSWAWQHFSWSAVLFMVCVSGCVVTAFSSAVLLKLVTIESESVGAVATPMEFATLDPSRKEKSE